MSDTAEERLKGLEAGTVTNLKKHIGAAGKKMAQLSRKAEKSVQDLESQLEGSESQSEVKQNDLTGTGSNLRRQIEVTEKQLAQLEETLNKARWLDRLQSIEKEKLVEFYREERKTEDKINKDVNTLFNETCKIVERIGRSFDDLKETRETISKIQRGLIKGSNQGREMKKAIELKKAKVIREVPVVEQLDSGTSLVRTVNIEMGSGESEDEDLWAKGFIRLPVYARDILDEVRRARGRPVRAKWDEWIRLAGIPEPRIIKAREELTKNLEVLREKGGIVYEEEGDTLVIRDNTQKEVRR